MNWFKHDTNASSDARIKKLLIRHGAMGYAVYFHCLELIAGNINETNITFELEHDAEIIADNLKILGDGNESGVDKVNKIMSTILELQLFDEIDNRIVCLKLAKRLDKSMTSNSSMRNLISDIRNDKKGYVYILESEYGHKIGKSKNFDERNRRFEVKLPFTFTTCRVYEVDDRHEAEANIHKKYGHKLINGEWFRLDTEDILNIDSHMLDLKSKIMINHDKSCKKEEIDKKEEKRTNKKEEIYGESDDSQTPKDNLSEPLPPKRRTVFKPPTIEEVKEYCEERKNGIDPDHFINFYSAKGWMIGKNKMKDWKASVRTWEKNQDKNNNEKKDYSKLTPLKMRDVSELED